jgi:hypothetical protein
MTISRANHPRLSDSNWKKINGWEDYFVHPLGFIKSVKKQISKNCYRQTTTEQILKMFPVRGYPAVNLISKKRRKSARVHRLVSEAFIKNIDKKPCINHKNGIKTDNRVDNLEWCTYSENEKHSYQTLGKISGRTKLTPQDKFNMRKLYKTGDYTQSELAEIFHVSARTIINSLKV